jgi:hypothetical protein
MSGEARARNQWPLILLAVSIALIIVGVVRCSFELAPAEGDEGAAPAESSQDAPASSESG